MLAEMLSPIDHLEVLDRVVERVSVDVVDMKSIGDGAEFTLPNRSMQMLGKADSSSLDRANEVDSRRPVLGVRIAPVSATVERDDFASPMFVHEKTVSDCVSDANGFHPVAVSIG